MKNTSGAMRIAISTIVLLVLAMVLLGVIISLVTGLFAPSKEKLLDILLTVDAGPKATSGDVFVGADAFFLKSRRDSIVIASFYNNGHPACEESTELFFWCPDVATYNNALSVPVPIGQEKTIGGILTLFSIPKGEYVCISKVVCGGDELIVEQHSIFKVDS